MRPLPRNPNPKSLSHQQCYDRNPMTDPNVPFRSVLRGYDQAQVDRHVHELEQAAQAARQEVGERAMQVDRLEAAQGQLRGEAERHAKRARALEEAQTKAVSPTYTSLGERIGSILMLADNEASELRTNATADAAKLTALADEKALATRRHADDYASEIRGAADAEAARLMDDTKRQTDSLLDQAERQATARREEAEALYERVRAESATAAVDFETTLAARRDETALELAAGVTAAEKQLAAVRLLSEESRAEFEQARQDAASRSAQQLEQAMTHARKIVAEAKTSAEHIRADSERELAAATQRRDSINLQLSNVRQMIAALGGSPIANPLDLAEPEAGQPKDSAAQEPVPQPADPAAAWQPKDSVAWKPREPAGAQKPKDAAPWRPKNPSGTGGQQPKPSTGAAWQPRDPAGAPKPKVADDAAKQDGTDRELTDEEARHRKAGMNPATGAKG